MHTPIIQDTCETEEVPITGSVGLLMNPVSRIVEVYVPHRNLTEIGPE